MRLMMGMVLSMMLSATGCTWLRPQTAEAPPSAERPDKPEAQQQSAGGGAGTSTMPMQNHQALPVEKTPSANSATAPMAASTSEVGAGGAPSAVEAKVLHPPRVVKNSGYSGTSTARGAAAGSMAPTPPKSPPADKLQAAVAPPTQPSLDLTSLEQRLRDTHAIGVFTKLSLKNQVDDLLAAVRAFHAGQAKTPLSDLRQKYDLLLMKVLSLLQDGDPPLAASISASREALWGILSNRDKFEKIQLS